MSILQKLRLLARGEAAGSRTQTETMPQSQTQADTETVRRIVNELEALEPERARYIAAFAYILSRVALTDQKVSEAERQTMEAIVQRIGHLPEAQAVLVVQMARHQSHLFGSTEDFLVTREFREISDETQRHELMDCLFATAAADDTIDSAEEAQIRQIANELRLTHQDFVAARAAYSDKRAVIKLLKETTGEGGSG